MASIAPRSARAATALGIKVSNSEAAPLGALRPPPPAGGSSALSPTDLALLVRDLQHSSQARRCGAWIGGRSRFVTFPAGEGGFLGCASSCGSPRCPRCRVSLMSDRRDDIQYRIDWWLSRSPLNQVSMLTLTAPHTADHSLSRFLGSTKARTGISGAVALLRESAVWKRFVREYVSGQETTVGRNGWHVHYHVLIFHVGELDQDAFFSTWRRCCLQAGLGAPSRVHGLTLQPAENAAAYMAKWGVAAEQTGAHVKDAKHGNRSISRLESAAARGNRSSRHLLKQFYAAMSRRRVHTFSRGLSVVGLRRLLWRKPTVTHYLLDQASSFRLQQDRALKPVLVQALADQALPPLQIFEQLGLVAQPIDHASAPRSQLPYEVQRRAKVFINKASKYEDIDKQCLTTILDKKEACLSILTDDLIKDILYRIAVYNS